MKIRAMRVILLLVLLSLALAPLAQILIPQG